MLQYEPFPKIPRLNRTITVTEKIDGTNASIWIGPLIDDNEELQVDPLHILDSWQEDGRRMVLRAGSRNGWLVPGRDDNYEFAAWVERHSGEVRGLGRGHHFGEWWGARIGGRYPMMRGRVFSLFNTSRWSDPSVRPACCDVSPVLYEGPMSLIAVDQAMTRLKVTGSEAVGKYVRHRYSRPSEPLQLVPRAEGVVVYHHAANIMFKVTADHDKVPKSMTGYRLKQFEAARTMAHLPASDRAALDEFAKLLRVMGHIPATA